MLIQCKRRSFSSPGRRADGVSLVSLMIALAIGMFLLAGIVVIWYQTRQTFGAQAGLSGAQESERMAISVITNAVQTAGYFPIYLNYPTASASIPSTRPAAFPVNATAAPPYPLAGEFISGSTASANHDVLSVRYMADGNTLDCLGQTDPVGAVVVESFSLDATGDLQCNVSVANGAAQSATVITGVAGLDVLYGVDNAGDGSVHQYMDASQVTSNNLWGAVHSVQVSLQMQNPLAGQPGQNDTLAPIVTTVAVTQQL
jgi:type IV pilus assembly protein PilW